MRLLLILFFLFITGTCFSQIYSNPNPGLYGIIYNRFKPLLVQHVPRKSELATNTNDSTPQIFVMGNDLWFYSNGNYYKAAAGSGFDSTKFVHYIDSLVKYVTPSQLKDSMAVIMPPGNEGTVPYIAISGTNKYKTGYLITQCKCVITDAQLDSAKQVFVTQAAAFSSWQRFSHGGNSGNPMTMGLNDTIPSIPSQTETFTYDGTNHLINSTFNSGPYVGLINSLSLTNYHIAATVSAKNNVDNDRIGIVAAYVEDAGDMVRNNAYGLNPADFSWPINTVDQYIPDQHTISVFRNRDDVTKEYYVYYDAGKPTQKLLYNGTSLLSYKPTGNWRSDTTEADVSILRNGDTLRIFTTEYADAPGGKGSLGKEIDILLTSDPVLFKFRGATQFGFVANSQVNAYWKNLSYSDDNQYIYDLRNGDVWVPDNTGVYTVDGSKNSYDLLGIGRYWYNVKEGSFGYLPQKDSFIVINKSSNNVRLINDADLPSVFTDGITISPEDRTVLKNFNMGAGSNFPIYLPLARSVPPGTEIEVGDNNTTFTYPYGIYINTQTGDHFGNSLSTQTPVYSVMGFKKKFKSDGYYTWTYNTDGVPYRNAEQDVNLGAHDLYARNIYASNELGATSHLFVGDNNTILSIYPTYMEIGGYSNPTTYRLQVSGGPLLQDWGPTKITVPGVNVTSFSGGGSSQYVMADASGNLVLSGIFAGNNIPVLSDIPALIAYSGPSTSVYVQDSLSGGMFNRILKGSYLSDGGVYITASSTDSLWLRQFNQANGVFPEWWGAKPYNYPVETPLTGFNSHNALQSAINYSSTKSLTVNLTRLYLSLDTLAIGENTHIRGNTALFPKQDDPAGVIYFKSQSGIFFNNSNGIVTTQETVDYRNQGIVLENFLINGAGQSKDGKYYTGVLLRTNPNSTSALTHPGLGRINGLYVANWHIGVDGTDALDTWDVGGLTHISQTDTAFITGKSGETIHHSDFFDCQVCLMVWGNENQITDNTFEAIEGNDTTHRKNIVVRGNTNIISGNVIRMGSIGMEMLGTAKDNIIHDNHFKVQDTAYISDSASKYNYVHSNTFTDNNPYASSGSRYIYDYKSVTNTYKDNVFVKEGTSITSIGTFDQSTGLIFMGATSPGFGNVATDYITFNNTTAPIISDYNGGRLFKNQNIIIGNVTSNTGALNITNSGQSGTLSNIYGVGYNTASRPALGFMYIKHAGSSTSPTSLTSSHILGDHQLYGDTASVGGGGGTMMVARWRVEADGTYSTTSAPSRMFWSVVPQGSTTLTDMLKLTGSGLRVGDGTTASATVDINGDLKIRTITNAAAGDSLLTTVVGASVKRLAQSQLTGISASNIGTGVLPNARISGLPNANLATMANNTIKGNVSGSTATPTDVTASQLLTMLNIVSGSYTPTLTNTTNISASSLSRATYTRSGGTVVHVSIGGSLTATAATANAVLTVTLPITTATTSQSYIGTGTIAENNGGANHYGAIVNIVSGTTATITFYPNTGSPVSSNFAVQFDYVL